MFVDSNGDHKEHPLNDDRYADASILISDNILDVVVREHAPQSIQKAGYNAVIAGSFRNIFWQFNQS